MFFKTIEKIFRYVSGFIRGSLSKKAARGAKELTEQQLKSPEKQQEKQVVSCNQEKQGCERHALRRERDSTPGADLCQYPATQGSQVTVSANASEDEHMDSKDDLQLKSAIEALLFIAGNPLTMERLKSIFEDVNQAMIEKQMESLRLDYEIRCSGIMLVDVAGGYQLVTRPENATWIRKFKSVKVSSRLSRPALETLAIIAYKQPVTRAEVEALRGVNIGGIIRNLMERRLVKIVGKKDVPGKPMLYGTTPEFLQYFGLKDLSSLPTLMECQELEMGEEVMEEVSIAREAAHQLEKSASEDAS